MKLHFETMGTGRPVVLLHGLFGSLNNWRTLGARLGASFQVFILDQRNHGLSEHSTEFSYGAMAEDLLEFLDDRGLASASLVGHSMGGKTAMTFAIRHPERMERLVVVDISPNRSPSNHDGILEAMTSLDLTRYRTRSEIEEALEGPIPDPRLRQFLLTNLKRLVGGRYVWRIDLDVIRGRLEDLNGHLEGEGTFGGPVLVLAGERSGYVLPDDLPAIRSRFPSAVVDVIPGAGHWVHADAPEEFLRRVTAFLLP
jgi:esterase